MEANDFTSASLLGKGGVYQEFYKGEYRGLNYTAPDALLFTTKCPSGHQNLSRVAPTDIEKTASGKRKFATNAVAKSCSTCLAPLTAPWQPTTTTEPTVTSFDEWLNRG